MRKDEREDKQFLEGSIRVVQGECDKCPDRGSAECKGYECPKWNNGWAVEEVSYGGSVDVIRENLLFSEIRGVYSEVLEEIRKETRDRLLGKRGK